MTVDLLICWYSLGWFACGLVFAISGKLDGPQFVLSFLLMPIALCLLLLHYVAEGFEKINTPKQYLWRRHR